MRYKRSGFGVRCHRRCCNHPGCWWERVAPASGIFIAHACRACQCDQQTAKMPLPPALSCPPWAQPRLLPARGVDRATGGARAAPTSEARCGVRHARAQVPAPRSGSKVRRGPAARRPCAAAVRVCVCEVYGGLLRDATDATRFPSARQELGPPGSRSQWPAKPQKRSVPGASECAIADAIWVPVRWARSGSLTSVGISPLLRRNRDALPKAAFIVLSHGNRMQVIGSACSSCLPQALPCARHTSLPFWGRRHCEKKTR
ncbi:hypothetical protein BC834DRAFT_345451 [Gloeopeniophorella convolvens]|nr:hypothetical protein BC834DRAFT_345451 [Gloeopeniophorella convolvens]